MRIDEPLGAQYWAHHNSAANYAVANRHIIVRGVQNALETVFGVRGEVFYEISHNLVQEEFLVLPDGSTQKGFVHRKGATRAFPAGHPDLIGTRWEGSGHPCLVPGSILLGAAILFPRGWGVSLRLLGQPRLRPRTQPRGRETGAVGVAPRHGSGDSRDPPHAGWGGGSAGRRDQGAYAARRVRPRLQGVLNTLTDQPRCILSQNSAAQWLAPYLRDVTVSFYADAVGAERLRADLELVPADVGVNVFIRVPTDESLFHDAVEPAPGVFCTGPVVTYLDLWIGNDRKREAAEHLARSLLPWLAERPRKERAL